MNRNRLTYRQKRIYIIIVFIIICFSLGLSYGRYIYNDIRDFYLASKSFYFNSDKLTPFRAIYQVDNWSGVDAYNLTINLNNSKNNLVHANSDIDYEISYTCSEKANCSISKNSGTLFQNNITDFFTAVISPNTALTNGDQVWMEITVNAIRPYKKKLSARFIFNVGIPGIAHAIDDVAGRPYFNLNVTNTTDFYLVKEAFGNFTVNQRIDYATYTKLSEVDKKKCALPLIKLSFDPSIVILDMTNSAYLNAENITTTNIGGYDYVNSVSFRIPLESSEVVKFYKASANMDYTYPIVNNQSIVNFSFSQ